MLPCVWHRQLQAENDKEPEALDDRVLLWDAPRN